MTNTGDLAVTVQAVTAQGRTPAFTRLADGLALSPDVPLPPGAGATALYQTVAPRCNDDIPWSETITITGTTSSSVLTTTQATITPALTTTLLPPQPAQADTIYIGCVIQLAAGLQAAAGQQSYDMVVINGPAPEGLILQGVQASYPYIDLFSLIEQTNALLREGCPTDSGCHTIRRLLIQQGKEIKIETVEALTLVSRVLLPLVRR